MPPELASKPPAGAISPGFNPALGQLQPVRLWEAGRRLHTYVVGQTGTGKSTLLSSKIIEDMRAGYCMTTNDLRDLPSCRRNFPGLPVLVLANKQFLPESKELFMKSLFAEYTTTVLFYSPLPAADEKLAGRRSNRNESIWPATSSQENNLG